MGKRGDRRRHNKKRAQRRESERDKKIYRMKMEQMEKKQTLWENIRTFFKKIF